MSELFAKVLIDNISDGICPGEWGLAIYLEYRGHKLLLDTGATGRFLDNAEDMGIDLSQVELGVLSHAHFDHSNGLSAFFEKNKTAPFYLREGSAEDCFDKQLFVKSYIGIRKGTMEKYKDRIRFASGDLEVLPGVYLIPHKTPGLELIGKKAKLYRQENGRFIPDDFRHEQSLVFETEKGLVVFNSCSHGGADNIVREVAETFPDQKIYAVIGGFHLFMSCRSEVLSFARRLKDTGIEKIVTGHCTGQKAYNLMKAELGDKLEQLRVGYELEI